MAARRGGISTVYDISRQLSSRAGFSRLFSSSSSRSPSSPTAQSRKQSIDRLSSVIDLVNDRKLPPELQGRGNSIRSETDLINVVERRIWNSMEEGAFESLAGKGKPLNLSSNPHADPSEETLYRILSKNGCFPEWIELNKEIRTAASKWRSALHAAWSLYDHGGGDNSNWEKSSETLKTQLKAINHKVFRDNLIVPFGRQMLGLDWEKELDLLKKLEQ